MITRTFFLQFGIAASIFAVMPISQIAFAETYPSRPIKLVVPFSPGGTADILGRALSERMGRSLGQPVVVENKPGAGGAIASNYVVRSASDGYTLLLGGTTQMVIDPILDAKRPYTDTDFTPIGFIAFSPLVMVVNAKSPVKTVDDFVKQAKARPGTENFGSSGNGTPTHIGAAWFNSAAGLDLVHVGYKGSPPALNALVGGEIQTLFDLVASARPLIDGGKLRPLAVTTSTRSAVLPDIPTLEELGYKDFDFAVRYVLLGPKSLDPAIVTHLNKELNAALQDPALATQLKNLALEVQPGSPDAVRQLSAREKGRLRVIVKANNITSSQ